MKRYVSEIKKNLEATYSIDQQITVLHYIKTRLNSLLKEKHTVLLAYQLLHHLDLYVERLPFLSTST